MTNTIKTFFMTSGINYEAFFFHVGIFIFLTITLLWLILAELELSEHSLPKQKEWPGNILRGLNKLVWGCSLTQLTARRGYPEWITKRHTDQGTKCM